MSRTPLSLYSSYYIDSKVDPAAVTNYGGIFPYLDLMLWSNSTTQMRTPSADMDRPMFLNRTKRFAACAG